MRLQFSLAELLLWSAAIPVWLFAIVVLGFGPGWGAMPGAYFIVPMVLMGITAALYHVLRRRPNAWAVAALLAPLVALVAIAIVAIAVHKNS